ncbi:MAG: type 1 glutamine amidotransferase [Gammaproteobacteria bacterium]|nr:type 1 glutamine amidotransferase [Gammaproteobacteria bacterium]
MRITLLQHVPFEGPGSIDPWCRQERLELNIAHLYRGDAVPQVQDFDGLVVMGGPMSVHDDAQHAWLANERALIEAAAGAGKPVLGICLGAQQIAAALGASVSRNPQPEIGWFPVQATGGIAGFSLPSSLTVFHWHGETFSLPPGATHLASSNICENQAFACSRNVLALQFHLETTPEGIGALIANCADELIDAPYVQSAAAMTAAAPAACRGLTTSMNDVLRYLFA